MANDLPYRVTGFGEAASAGPGGAGAGGVVSGGEIT